MDGVGESDTDEPVWGLGWAGGVAWASWMGLGTGTGAQRRDARVRAMQALTPRRSLTVEDGTTWAYYDTGPDDAVPIVCVHGALETAEAFQAQASTLAGANYRVITCAYPTGIDSRAAWVSGFHLLLSSLSRGPRVHLCGHGLGAALARRFCARYPARVASLVMISPSGDPPPSGDEVFTALLPLAPAALLRRTLRSACFPAGAPPTGDGGGAESDADSSGETRDELEAAAVAAALAGAAEWGAWAEAEEEAPGSVPRDLLRQTREAWAREVGTRRWRQRRRAEDVRAEAEAAETVEGLSRAELLARAQLLHDSTPADTVTSLLPSQVLIMEPVDRTRGLRAAGHMARETVGAESVQLKGGGDFPLQAAAEEVSMLLTVFLRRQGLDPRSTGSEKA